jgi:hypothetical protein
MRVSVSGVCADRFWQWTDDRFQLPSVGEILVARDESMEAEWDELGYALNSDGEGPFAIYYETIKRSATLLKALEDPYDRELSRFEPYDLTLVGQGLFLVTLVTPGSDSPFSRLLLEAFVTALGQ